MAQTPIQKIARKLKFKKDGLEILIQALTHKSYLGESGQVGSNERLEFLGDSVLGLVVAENLFSRFGEKAEGELAKAKAVCVSEPILAEAARNIGLSEVIYMSSGEETSGGRNRSSILADSFEAIVAAIYLNQGLEAARAFVLKSLDSILDDIESEEHHRNYKSVLQELSQRLFKKAPRYEVITESGADHDKTFIVEAQLDGNPLGRGSGKSKKQAEQAAAFEALKHPVFEEKETRRRPTNERESS
ncbi:MAG TPA: ribonuclease III [Armatimonadota bacterium]|jgi:ribonuclease-3